MDEAQVLPSETLILVLQTSRTFKQLKFDDWDLEKKDKKKKETALKCDIRKGDANMWMWVSGGT